MAKEKYAVHSKTAAVGRAIEDSRIHRSSKANAIRYAIWKVKHDIIIKPSWYSELEKKITKN